MPGGGGARADAEFTPAQMAKFVIDEHLRRAPPNWAMVVIEACGAGRFAMLVGAEVQRAGAVGGLLIIGAGPAEGESHLGVFRSALARVLSRYGPNDVTISLGDFAARIKEDLESSRRGYVFPGMFSDCDHVRGPVALVGPLTAPVDAYDELIDAVAALSAEERDHFGGQDLSVGLGEFGWHFAWPPAGASGDPALARHAGPWRSRPHGRTRNRQVSPHRACAAARPSRHPRRAAPRRAR